MLRNGNYVTAAGSRVKVSGSHSGIFTIDFDWLEEDGACSDCHPSVDRDEGYLRWDCEYHDSGSAKLKGEEK